MIRQAFFVEKNNNIDTYITEDNILADYFSTQRSDNSYVSNLYKGRIIRVVDSINAAFVNIGLERNAFLPLNELSSFENLHNEKLKQGDTVIVQVKKDSYKDKGAFLTRDVAMYGKYTIFMPNNHHIGISTKIFNNSNRKKLVTLGITLCNNECGIVFRTAAESVDSQVLSDEFFLLKQKYISITSGVEYISAPTCIFKKQNGINNIINEVLKLPGKTIINITKELYNRNSELPQNIEINFIENDYTKKFATELEKIYKHKVLLKNGANIIIDQCEAMTVIDVNSSGFTKSKNKEISSLETNIIACNEIARQIKLRNISGIIVVDFINLIDEQNKIKIIDELKKLILNDRIKCVVHGFTNLGLLEMTRKRTSVVLNSKYKICPLCKGKGEILSKD